MSAYPKWKYHKTEEAVVVPHEDAEAALGLGWCDNQIIANESPEFYSPPRAVVLPATDPVPLNVGRDDEVGLEVIHTPEEHKAPLEPVKSKKK